MSTQTINEVLDILINSIMIPLLLALASSAVVIVKSYGKKIVDSIIAKNDLESISQKNTIKTLLLEQLQKIVETAVGSNMQTADQFKIECPKLTDEQKQILLDAAKECIMASLPPQLKDDDSDLLTIIGGKEQLEVIIDNMIEKVVYDYKMKKTTSNI